MKSTVEQLNWPWTGHSKHMLHLIVQHCVTLWVDMSANSPFKGFIGWELECRNWQALFMRAHIRKYHLRGTNVSFPWQKHSDFFQRVLKRHPQSAWEDTVLLVHVVSVQLDFSLRVQLRSCTWLFVVLIDYNLLLSTNLIGSCSHLNFWSVSLDLFFQP